LAMKPPRNPNILMRLENLALIHQDIRGQCYIPADVIAREIRNLDRAIKFQLNPTSDDSGDLLVVTSGGLHRVSLTGAPWQVLRVLEENKDSAVSFDDLDKSLSLKKKAAQNAIGRLQLKLRDAQGQLANLIENVY